MLRIYTVLAAIAATLLTTLAAIPANAAAVVIWPVDPTIPAGERSAAIWLENRGKETVTLQIRSFTWAQQGGAEDYVDQTEVVASPPVADVAPGKRQLVRVIRRNTASPTPERAYRLMIDEVPNPTEAGEAGAKLAVQLRYSIPLFTFSEAGKASPKLTARIVTVEGKPFVEIHNGGAGHARLTDLRLTGAGEPTMLTSGLVGYVLPGATMRWPLATPTVPQGALLVGVNGTDEKLGAAL